MPTSRFRARIGVPERSYRRWRARQRTGWPVKGPWPAPVAESVEPVVVKHAEAHPAWGHREVWALCRFDGVVVSPSTVERVMRRRGLLQDRDYTAELRAWAAQRRAAFTDPPTGPNQVWQLDFSQFETTGGGTWRIAGCADYLAKYEFGWHISTTCTATDAIAAVQLAIAEAETLFGRPLIDALLRDEHDQPIPTKLVTDNGAAFESTSSFRYVRERRAQPAAPVGAVLPRARRHEGTPALRRSRGAQRRARTSRASAWRKPRTELVDIDAPESEWVWFDDPVQESPFA